MLVVGVLVDSHVHAFWLPPLVKEHVSESKSQAINVLGTAVAPCQVQVEKSASSATLALAVGRSGGGIAPRLEPGPGLEYIQLKSLLCASRTVLAVRSPVARRSTACR